MLGEIQGYAGAAIEHDHGSNISNTRTSRQRRQQVVALCIPRKQGVKGRTQAINGVLYTLETNNGKPAPAVYLHDIPHVVNGPGAAFDTELYDGKRATNPKIPDDFTSYVTVHKTWSFTDRNDNRPAELYQLRRPIGFKTYPGDKAAYAPETFDDKIVLESFSVRRLVQGLDRLASDLLRMRA
jgi:hypothetical protein